MPLPLVPIALAGAGALIGGTLSAAQTKEPRNQFRNFLGGAIAGGLTGGFGAGLAGHASKAIAGKGIGDVLGGMYAGTGGKVALGIDLMQSLPAAYFALQDGKLDVGDAMSIASPFFGTAVGSALGSRRINEKGREYISKEAGRRFPKGNYDDHYAAIEKNLLEQINDPKRRAKVKDYWDMDHSPIGLGADIGLGFMSTFFH